jgi:hypothetical protein
MENMNEYLYGRTVFGGEEAVLAHYERKKAAAKALLRALQAVPLGDRDILRINGVVKAISWCDDRISETKEALRKSYT